MRSEELRDWYSSPSVIRMMRWAGHVARIEAKSNAYRILIGKPEERSLGRPRGWWVDNIKMDFLEMGWSTVDWNGLA
jgi:hypothetical protein